MPDRRCCQARTAQARASISRYRQNVNARGLSWASPIFRNGKLTPQTTAVTSATTAGRFLLMLVQHAGWGLQRGAGKGAPLAVRGAGTRRGRRVDVFEAPGKGWKLRCVAPGTRRG